MASACGTPSVRADLNQNTKTNGVVTSDVDELVAAALGARENSYSIYSKFRVGAALRTADGRVFTGCNVENASYGLAICAERTALVKAVSEGCRKFQAIAIASDLAEFISPCGACRQFIREFGADITVIMTKPDGTHTSCSIDTLIPGAFTPDDLASTSSSQ